MYIIIVIKIIYFKFAKVIASVQLFL